ncbi:unnamed protein product [Closterium sp. NIES-53]
MEVARTSMIHAPAPHFLWPFAVWYAVHQLNLWPRVSLPETSPTLRWTGKVGNASVFRVWGSRAFVCDTSADKLSPRAIPCVFLGYDVTFDESVPFYRLFPYRSAPPPPPPRRSSLLPVDPLSGPAPAQVAVDSGAARGAASGGAEPGGAEPRGAEGVATGSGEPGSAEPEGVEPGGVASEGAESGSAEPQGATSSGGSAGASPRLSSQQLREWFVQRTRLLSGASGAGGALAAVAGGTGVAAGAGVTGGTVTTEPGAGDLTESGTTGAGGAGAGGAGVGGRGAGGAGVDSPGVGGVGGVGAGGAGAVDLGGTLRPRPYFVPLLQQGSLHKEIWLRRQPGFTESFLAGTQWSLQRPVYGLRQAPREWHNTVRTTLAALGFAPSTADPSMFLRTDTSLPPFYVLVYVDDLVFVTADTEALTLVKSELQKRHTCTDMADLRSYLRLQITLDRARRTITLM